MLQRLVRAYNINKLFFEFIPYEGNWDSNWCVKHWGTKWDINDSNEIDVPTKHCEIILKFTTAWRPPIAFYSVLYDQGFSIDAYYHEPWWRFCGHWENDGDDNVYDIEEYTEEWINENIPNSIIESMNLSDYYEEKEDNDPRHYQLPLKMMVRIKGDVIVCPICLDRDFTKMVVPECHHIICQTCAEELIYNRINQCPICRKTPYFKLINQTD